MLGFASSTWLACIGLQDSLLATAVGASVLAVRVRMSALQVHRFGLERAGRMGANVISLRMASGKVCPGIARTVLAAQWAKQPA